MRVTMTERLQKLVDRMQALPEAEQEQYAERFLAQLEAVNGPKQVEAEDHRPFWEVLQDIMSDVPDEEWEQYPEDGAAELDHYLYGTPKRNA